jgi:signal transduction histidine kinase
LKHGPRGVPVGIELLREEREEGEWAVLSVRDEGPGIPPQLLSRLFSPFVSGPGSTGLGIGLFLAHSIAQAHGGDLTVESTPGMGTTFRLLLPTAGTQSDA